MPHETHLIQSLPPSPSRTPNPTSSPSTSPKRPNLWSILKDSIGKDLARITLPVVFNEPLSFLQRLAEDVEYSHLLDQAALTSGPQRAALVAAFILSHYSSTTGRPSKPFNPLLGETFELNIPGKLALVAEQVAHHPPVSAIHVRGPAWVYRTAHEIKNKFRGNALEVWPEGAVHIQFDDGEHFVYQQAHTFVNNIIMGDMCIDNAGTITVREVTHDAFVTTIKLKRSGSLFGDARALGEFSGSVCTTGAKPRVLCKLSGSWNAEVRVDGRVVWSVAQRPSKQLTGGHSMTAWAWNLNAEGGESHLARTDSRLRPDQKAWERGLYREATAEKERLENAQRARRRENESEGVSIEPRWFELRREESTGRNEWVYRMNYWETKNEGWPTDLPYIF